MCKTCGKTWHIWQWRKMAILAYNCFLTGEKATILAYNCFLTGEKRPFWHRIKSDRGEDDRSGTEMLCCCWMVVLHSGIESNLTGQKITIPAQNAWPDQSFFFWGWNFATWRQRQFESYKGCFWGKKIKIKILQNRHNFSKKKNGNRHM